MTKKLVCLLLISLGSVFQLAAQSLEKDTIKMAALTVFANGKAESINWQSISLAEAAIKAKAEKKHILVYFTAKWCGPCRKMEQEVFPNFEVKRVVNDNYIAIKIDVDAWGGKNWTKKFGVKGVPDFFILNEELQRQRHTLGGMGTKKMLEFLDLTVPPNDPKMLDTTFYALPIEHWKNKIALTIGAGSSRFNNLAYHNRFAYEIALSLHLEKKRLLFSSGITFLRIGAATNPLSYIKFPAEVALNFYRGKLGWLAGGFSILAAPYYSRMINHQTSLNRNDIGFDYGIAAYIGDANQASLALAVKGTQGLTDVFPKLLGRQTNQFFRVALTLAIR